MFQLASLRLCDTHHICTVFSIYLFGRVCYSASFIRFIVDMIGEIMGEIQISAHILQCTSQKQPNKNRTKNLADEQRILTKIAYQD